MQHTLSLANSSGESQACTLLETRGYNGGPKKDLKRHNQVSNFQYINMNSSNCQTSACFLTALRYCLEESEKTKTNNCICSYFQIRQYSKHHLNRLCCEPSRVYLVGFLSKFCPYLGIWKILAKEHDHHLMEVWCCFHRKSLKQSVKFICFSQM